MITKLGGILCVVVGLVVQGVTPLSAQGRASSAASPVVFSSASGSLLHSPHAVVAGQGITLSWPDQGAPRLSPSAQAPQPAAAKKKGGRKVVWITLAASVAAVSLAVAFAPQAPIPTTPSRTSGGCTMFYRPGTLMTTSGYTCTSR